MKIYDTLDLTRSDIVIGQHSMWLPTEQIKVPFQWGGRLQKYRRIAEASYPLDLIWEEVSLLRALGSRQMSPEIGEWVYFKTVISEHPGAWWADPCGAYGYEMQDATTISPGLFDFEQFKSIGLAAGSTRAWNDLNKAGNVVNGHLIDVHRSGWDRLRRTIPYITAPTLYQEDPEQLQADLMRDGQFPFQQRSESYQEYFLGKWWPGERQVQNRAATLGFRPRADERVLDLGCQVGGFLQLAYCPGEQARLVGIDSEAAYIDLARRLARAQGWNICYRQGSVEDLALHDWIHQLWGPDGVDHLLMLSMMKHLSQGESTLWQVVDHLRPWVTYLETNAVKEGARAPLSEAVKARHGQLMGWTKDRNIRAVYRLKRVH